MGGIPLPLMNAQYDAIMRSYASKRAISPRDLEERVMNIQKQVPELS